MARPGDELAAGGGDTLRHPLAGACSSMVEPAAHNGLVGGSNPSGPTGGKLAAFVVAAAATRTPRRLYWKHAAISLIGIIIAVLAVTSLRRMAHEITLHDLASAVRAVPMTALLTVAGLTTLSYCILIGYDALALSHLGYRLPLPTVAAASFASFTMSHTLGLTALTGGSVRYRLYTRAGVRAHDVVLIVALAGPSGSVWCSRRVSGSSSIPAPSP